MMSELFSIQVLRSAGWILVAGVALPLILGIARAVFQKPDPDALGRGFGVAAILDAIDGLRAQVRRRVEIPWATRLLDWILLSRGKGAPRGSSAASGAQDLPPVEPDPVYHRAWLEFPASPRSAAPSTE